MQQRSHPHRAPVSYLMHCAVHMQGGFHIFQGLVIMALRRISMMYVA